MNIDHLTKSKAIQNVVKRAVTEGWRKSSAVSDAMAWLQRDEKNLANRQAVREFVDAEYDAAKLDYVGRKV